MKKKNNNQILIKTISIICIIILIANILLFAFRIYSAMIMWIVIVIIAIIAFPGMKILKRKLK
jgi:hypothetical protein